MAVAQTCITSTSVHDVDKAIGAPPRLATATAGGETPVASWRPCFLSSVLIFVVRASPVPSVVASFSAPAESEARICVHNANMPQHLGKDGYARDRSGTAFAHVQPTYLGFNLDAPRAAAPFSDGKDVDVGRRRARRVRHCHFVLVLLGLIEFSRAVEGGSSYIGRGVKVAFRIRASRNGESYLHRLTCRAS